eukprot:CAMPEP_0176500434 /NCGR_PEP_ID=MMETSP0200_2-20121128/13546_1 /TAXON_ID=947934 /ORGANISM="Chaetoceros sp., Strain GSL56" /LENGTH=1357 /DNA_ID=CAMNT_0017899095 /DNA_START=232 /DNA_END=4305 /DNA_ORIENTATION=-
MSNLVQKRLGHVIESHQVALSLTSPSTNPSSTFPTSASIKSTSKAAQLRSFTYLNDPTVAPSSAVADIDLNPPERSRPQDLLKGCLQGSSAPPTITTANLVDAEVQSGESHICHTPNDHLNYYNTTIKAITAMSVLCEEASEMYNLSTTKFLPQLHIFARDLKLDANEKDKEVNMLDEGLMIQRDKELLKRIGKFIPLLQQTYNYTNRIQKLVANIACQIHGCMVPLYDWSMDAESLGTKNIDLGNEDESQLPRLFGNVRNVMPLVESLAKLLEILIELDVAVANNGELMDAWDLYKSVVMDHGNSSSGDDEHGKCEGEDGGGDSRPVPFVDIHVGGNPSQSLVTDGHEGDVDPNEQICEGAKDDCEQQNLSQDSNTSDEQLGDEKESMEKTSSFQLNDQDATKTNDQDALPSNTSKEDLRMLQRMLMQLDFTLLSSRTFLMAIEQNFDPENEMFRDKNDNPLHMYIKDGLEILYNRCCASIGTSSQSNMESIPVKGIYGLYCLYRRILPTNVAPDDKLHRSLCTLLPSKCPIIPYFGELPFFPAEFLSRYAPLKRKMEKDPSTMDDILATAKKFCSKQDKVFGTSVSTLHRKGVAWMISAECDLAPSAHTGEEEESLSSAVETVSHQIGIFLQGIQISRQATSILRQYLALHKNLMMPIPSINLSAIEKLCSLAKGIEQMLRRRRRTCLVCIHKAALKLLASTIFRKLEPIRSYVDHKHSSLDDSQEFETKQLKISRIGASLSALEALLKGSSSFSTTRIFTIKVALCSCYEESPSFLSDHVRNQELLDLLQQLNTISDFDNIVDEASDCSFLYFHRALHAPLVRYAYQKGAGIQMIFSALSDASKTILPSSTYLNILYDRPLHLDQYRQDLVVTLLVREIVQPLEDEIESILRQRVLARKIEEMPSISPKEAIFHRKMIDSLPIECCGMKFNIKSAVERALEKSLYISSTVGLMDSATHAEMFVVAQRYGLNIIDNHLPLKRADKTYDIVDIIDNLHEFISSHQYNMNQQKFVEKISKSGRRSFSSLDIERVSLSLSCHGEALARLAIDRINDYISKSLLEFQDVLSDDIFFSSIAKEIRWFEEEVKKRNSFYGYDRAHAFKSELLEIKAAKDGRSQLERAKDSLTNIGAALGFIRLLHSGLLCKNNSERQFCIGLHEIMQSKQLTGHMLEPSLRRLNHYSTDLKQDFVTNRFQKSVAVSDTGRMQILDCSFILYPALSLLWLDSTLNAKEALRKRSKGPEREYADDGLAFGYAYIFEMISKKQGVKYDELKWSSSLRSKLSSEKSEILKKAEATKLSQAKNQSISMFPLMSDVSPTDDEYTRLQVQARRIEARQKELEFLNYSTNAARIILSSK